MTLVVADDGPGIAPDMLDRLFRPFERLGAEQSSVEGTGLGLALSKGFVEAMGGTIHATSTLGEGTTFTIELAAAEPRRLTQPTPVVEAPPGGPGTARRTVLCIEDNPSNIELIEQIFAARPDINVLTAVQGRLGVELARDHRPDLVLLDLNLPDVAGETVLERLQAHPATATVPVVVVSADATAGQLERMMARGAHAYLTKPIDVARLLGVVDDALSADSRRAA